MSSIVLATILKLLEYTTSVVLRLLAGIYVILLETRSIYLPRSSESTLYELFLCWFELFSLWELRIQLSIQPLRLDEGRHTVIIG